MQTSSLSSAPRVLASAAAGITDAIGRHNGDVDRIFGNAAIRTDALDSPYNELKLKQFCSLVDEAAKQTGYDNFGLEFGSRYMPKQLGALGFAAISCPTLSATLKCLEQYFPAHQGQTNLQLVQDSGILWLNYRIFDERIENRRQDAELSLGVFVNIFRHALGRNWSPLEVKFEHDRPDHILDHESFFGSSVHFGRRTNSLAFRRSDLDAQMPEQDPYLFSVMEPFLKSRSNLHEDVIDFAARVREQIKSLMDDRAPTVSEVSNALGLPEAGFQKQLKTRNLTFNDLMRAARQELALHFLKNKDLPLTEVAFRLGYSELSAFSRAFRSWTGQNPQRYRRLNDES